MCSVQQGTFELEISQLPATGLRNLPESPSAIANFPHLRIDHMQTCNMIPDSSSERLAFHNAEFAYVGSRACSFTRASSVLVSRCRRRQRPVKALPRNWRCALPEDTETKVDNDAVPADEAVDIAQVEGALAIDTLDADLEAALSKGWDQLELFDSMDEAENDETDSTDGEEEEEEDEFSTLEQESVSEQDEDTDTSSSNVEEDAPVQFLESSASKESDDAAAAIREAKQPKKRKPKASAKKKETKKTTKGKKSTKAGKDEEVREMTQREMLNSEVWDPEPRWFFLQVKPGCEQSCAISLRNMAESLENLEVLEVLVPAITIMRLTKGGKSVKKEERMFPGYILILMVMNRQNYADVQRVPNVQWFMGDPNREKQKDQPFRPPLPVSDAEMSAVFEKVRAADSAKPEKKTTLRPGDAIKVISGTHSGSVGRVVEVKPDTQLVKAKLKAFGGITTEELEFGQVEVVEDSELEDPVIEESPDSSQKTDQLEKDGSAPREGYSAGVASAEDDLAFLLGDDGEDNEYANWDPLSSKGDDGFSEGEIFDQPEETPDLDKLINTEMKSNKSNSAAKNEINDFESFLGDDLAEFLGNDDDSNLWDPQVPSKTNGPDRSKPESPIESEDSSKGYSAEDDPFSFLDSDETEDSWFPERMP